MLKYNQINPLNVFGMRRMAHCPPHFETLVFDIRTQEKNLTDWVYENLAGRFYFGDHFYTTDGGSVALSKMIAFEEHSELSYFGLFLDTINHG